MPPNYRTLPAIVTNLSSRNIQSTHLATLPHQQHDKRGAPSLHEFSEGGWALGSRTHQVDQRAASRTKAAQRRTETVRRGKRREEKTARSQTEERGSRIEAAGRRKRREGKTARSRAEAAGRREQKTARTSPQGQGAKLERAKKEGEQALQANELALKEKELELERARKESTEALASQQASSPTPAASNAPLSRLNALVPKWTEEKPEAWLEEVEALFDNFNTTEAERALVLTKHLEGKAKAALHPLEQSQ
ncbi:arginine and glutamate-rich protein 1-B-like [Macrobrachium rosenbergii]|uniref:arginine and glutamate-rich protein 1-B-like n=1 Tax=Macrobrachium rosenbergii TaxID=79674 RepID=UPI0034D72DAC